MNLRPEKKRVTVYFDPALFKALKIKAVESENSMSDLINEAVRLNLLEDAEDLQAIEDRKNEPVYDFDTGEKSMNKKFHLALSVQDLQKSITDYSQKLGLKPEVVVENTYALWRTEFLNLSIRIDSKVKPGSLRHIGLESEKYQTFKTETDCNDILWEFFNEKLQKEEIAEHFGTNDS